MQISQDQRETIEKLLNEALKEGSSIANPIGLNEYLWKMVQVYARPEIMQLDKAIGRVSDIPTLTILKANKANSLYFQCCYMNSIISNSGNTRVPPGYKIVVEGTANNESKTLIGKMPCLQPLERWELVLPQKYEKIALIILQGMNIALSRIISFTQCHYLSMNWYLDFQEIDANCLTCVLLIALIHIHFGNENMNTVQYRIINQFEQFENNQATMSEEVKEKKPSKKKSSTSTKKDDTKSKDDKKRKKSTASSKKSSVSGSKKGESPTPSHEDFHTETLLSDKEKEKPQIEERLPLPPEQITPNFPIHQPMSFPSYPDPRFQPYPQPRGPPKPIPQRSCVHHNLPLRYYCEACEEPICEDCHSIGPHNTELHRVATLQEAFAARYNYLSGGTYKTLLEKRDKLLAQLDKIDYRIAEIKSVAGIIERDIKTEYAGMLERLKSAEGVKYAVLQHDMAGIQKDIERIDTIFDSLDEYLQGELRGDYVGFLIKFRELHEYIEYAITKPFKVKIEVVPNDLPRELTEKRKTLERAEQSESLLKFKDEIIWNLIQEKKKLSRMAEIDLDKAVQQEWNEWAKLIEKYCEELLKYQLVCSFCGTALDDLTVNSACPGNTGHKISETRHTFEEPPVEYKGIGRHYFAKPVKQQSGTQSFLAKVMMDPKTLATYNAIKEGSREKFGEFKKRLSELDRDGRGDVSQSEFKDVILELYSVEEEAAGKLSEALSGGGRRVQYKQLLQHIDGSSKSGASSRYEKSIEKDDLVQKIAESIKKKGLDKEELLKRFEKYDEDHKGKVKLDEFYLVMMRLGIVVSNQEIDALAKMVNPDVERVGEINYTEFINKLLFQPYTQFLPFFISYCYQTHSAIVCEEQHIDKIHYYRGTQSIVCVYSNFPTIRNSYCIIIALE
eukprot:TRINITY_DN87965_c1_g1_i1.p1 TRINITY_DN87965_c1_g1~~TRINITY_DN87965_c1_g1_i1.p1  ORF type:complete len:901 (+),score=98.93 TRINITY_DN87965_c1_g1_i1:1663-4365(+)